MKKKKSSNLLFTILILIGVIGFLACFCWFMYPYASSFLSKQEHKRVVQRYVTDIQELSEEEISEILEAAYEYNRQLQNKHHRYLMNEEEEAEYQSQLRIPSSDIIGVLEIPVINVKLPMYHDTNEGILQIGIGHYKGTSLPVGGAGTHTVVTGHRGVPSSELLTKLNKVDEGDVFMFHVLKQTVTYLVDRVEIVLPEVVRDYIGIEPDMDYATVITCHPYSVNSHRMLVRGHRIENIVETAYEDMASEAKQPDNTLLIIAITAIISVIILIIIITVLICRKRNKKKAKVAQNDEKENNIIN